MPQVIESFALNQPVTVGQSETKVEGFSWAGKNPINFWLSV